MSGAVLSKCFVGMLSMSPSRRRTTPKSLWWGTWSHHVQKGYAHAKTCHRRVPSHRRCFYVLQQDSFISENPGWDVHEISMLKLFILKIHKWISMCLYPWTMDVHSNILKRIDFSAWVLPWILHGYFNTRKGHNYCFFSEAFSKKIFYKFWKVQFLLSPPPPFMDEWSDASNKWT